MQSTPSAHLVLDLLFEAFQLDSIVIFNNIAGTFLISITK